jgi:hypothetical protein
MACFYAYIGYIGNTMGQNTRCGLTEAMMQEHELQEHKLQVHCLASSHRYSPTYIFTSWAWMFIAISII